VQYEGCTEFICKAGKVVVCDAMTKKKGEIIDKRFEIVPVKTLSAEARLAVVFQLMVS
jgi:hypothetical protein